MKAGILAKSYLMGTVIPMVIYLAAGIYDIITQEDNSALVVTVIEGILLLALPLYFLGREEELNSKCPTKWIAPVYLAGYAVITLIMALVINILDMNALFGHQFLGGIGLWIMWIVMAGGFVWALLFRTGVLIVNAIKNKS